MENNKKEIRYWLMKDKNNEYFFVLNYKKPLLTHCKESVGEWHFKQTLTHIFKGIPNNSPNLIEVQFFKRKEYDTDIPVIINKTKDCFYIYFDLTPINYNGRMFYMPDLKNCLLLDKSFFENRIHYLDQIKREGFYLFYLRAIGDTELRRSWLSYDRKNGYMFHIGSRPVPTEYTDIIPADGQHREFADTYQVWEDYAKDVEFSYEEINGIDLSGNCGFIETYMSFNPEGAIAEFVLTCVAKGKYLAGKERRERQKHYWFESGELFQKCFPFELEVGESKTIYIHKK